MISMTSLHKILQVKDKALPVTTLACNQRRSRGKHVCCLTRWTRTMILEVVTYKESCLDLDLVRLLLKNDVSCLVLFPIYAHFSSLIPSCFLFLNYFSSWIQSCFEILGLVPPRLQKKRSRPPLRQAIRLYPWPASPPWAWPSRLICVNDKLGCRKSWGKGVLKSW